MHKKKSPSRIKYELNNPTVSGRVPKETREKLLEGLRKLDMSVADGLKVLAGEVKVKVIPIDLARKQGYEEARNIYMITYLCPVCTKPVAITSPKTKEMVRQYMAEFGPGHAKCHEQSS